MKQYDETSSFAQRSLFKLSPVALVIASLGLAFQSAAFAADAQAHQINNAVVNNDQVNKLQQYNIDSGTLSHVLSEFAGQAGVALSFNANQFIGLQSSGLKGRYTIEQGFTKLLSVTSYKVEKQKSGSYTIKSLTTNDRVMTLATAQVTDNALGSNTENTGSYTTGSMASATGLNMSVRDTPQSVSVITTQLIQDQDLRTLTDVINSATGISSKEKDSTRFGYSARGFSIESYQVDGMPIPVSGAGESDSSLAIYERVEVVRGAAGLLTGAGNPSAAINLVRKRANSEEFTANLSAGYGSWNNYRATADVGSALNDSGSVRARVVLNYEAGDSHIDYASNEKTVVYGVIDADISDNTQISAGISYQDNQPKGSTWGGLPTWYSDGSRTHWDRSKTTGAEWTYWASTNTSYFINLSHQLSSNWQLSVDASQSKVDIDRKLIYMYVNGRNGDKGVDKTTGLGLTALPTYRDEEYTTTNLAMQLVGQFDLFNQSHEVIFGANQSEDEKLTFEHKKTDVAPVGNFFNWNGKYPQPAWGETFERNDYTTKQSGFYAATRLSLTDKVKVIVGGRLSNWQQKGLYNKKDVDYSDDSVFTPYFGALYDINEQHTLYASYTDIFKPQNKQDKQGEFFEPLTGNNYELGLKSEFFDGLLTTSAAIFKIEQQNLGVKGEKIIFANGDLPTQTYDAVEHATSEGFEVEVVGEVLPGWNISLSYSQFDLESGDKGAINTDQPDQLLKLYSSYNFVDSLDKLTIAGGVNWQGDSYKDTKNPVTGDSEKLTQEAYALVSFMTKYQITEQLTTQLNIENLFDKKYYSQLGFYNQYAYGEPRNINLSVKYLF